MFVVVIVVVVVVVIYCSKSYVGIKEKKSNEAKKKRRNGLTGKGESYSRSRRFKILTSSLYRFDLFIDMVLPLKIVNHDLVHLFLAMTNTCHLHIPIFYGPSQTR